MRLHRIIALLFVLAGCKVERINLGSQENAGTTSPTHLTYATNPVVSAVGQVVPDNLPSSGGGAVTSYAIAPELPAGLSLDTKTGILFGTPTVISSETDYTVTAANAAGSTAASLTITVNDIAPVKLVYPSNPATYTRGVPILNNAPTSSGGAVVSYKITPELPAGLTIDGTSGIIAGTPTVLSSTTTYTVTATNSGGTTTATLVLTVNDVAPSELVYLTNPATYTLGEPITDNGPTSSGGTVISYEITPTLPAGLSFDAVTGVIAGTPAQLAARTAYIVTATNSSGSITTTVRITVNDVAPSALAYLTNPATYTLGQPITDNGPTSSGGAVISYEITPELPAGLSFDTTTGVISGTPTVLSSGKIYTVTAMNSGGTTTASLTIAVVDVPPSAFTYGVNPATYTKGVAIATNRPSSSGGVALEYSITPDLPAGLQFDQITGEISGTPTALSAATDHTVTATNSGGSTTTVLTITVVDVPPTGLTYATNPATYTLGQAIEENAPAGGGGAVVAWSVQPSLPSGLHLDPTTGVISGTPSILSPATNYTVTATNTGGSQTATLTITVVDVPPSALTYVTNPATYTLGQPITNNVPTSSGGAVISYEITPALPPGLSFDTTTGVIAGTPAQLAARTDYTVTATNSGGSTTVIVAIAVNDVSPSALIYLSNPATYTLGQPITDNGPTSSGGAVVSYEITPELPAGLSFDTTTGVISGTPTVLSSAKIYTVTAMNSGGTTTASLAISVVDVPPAALTYAVNPATYTKGVAIATNRPSSSGGVVLAYSITPDLPSGLQFDQITGEISGTPTALSSATDYTVTATNSGGSTTTVLTITVVDVPPTGLSYATNPATYTLGQPIPNNVLTSSGGAVVSYSISSALPAGLSFNTSTGVISGTPSALSPKTNYTVTATNSGGSTTATLAITVNEAAPSNLSYSANPAVYTRGQAIPDNVPTSSGGAVVSYSISPSMGSGLSINTTTGVISGVPSLAMYRRQYTVTATNSGGSISVTLVITVNDVAPSNLSYSTNPAVYARGLAITNNVPTNTGDRPFSYSISSALPAGLSFDTTTGVISGTPTVASPTTGYTITALNSGGSTSVVLTIVVRDSVLTGLTDTVSLGGSHTCAVVNGGVRCWGANSYGQLGNNSTTKSSVPVAVSGLTSGVKSIAAGSEHTCAVVNGGVQCWGRNDFGQLGNNSTTGSLVPVPVSGLTSGVQAIAAGSFHTCALVNGGVRCWGFNVSGQLGSNSSMDSAVPVAVSGLTSGVQAIKAGGYNTCALVNGGVQCWGDNYYGQLGNNTTATSSVPVPVIGLTSGVQAIATGNSHSCALVNGGVKCWGWNFVGQLGDNNKPPTADPNAMSRVPVAVFGLTSGVQSIAAGTSHTCALVNGGLQCWGYDYSGQLGDNKSGTSSWVPVAVVGLTSGVQSIAAGGAHTCAVTNGGLRCWGDNSAGQLGNNSTTRSTVPVAVVGLDNSLQAMAVNSDHDCAVVNGGVQCWGRNNYGQLGNNSTTGSLVPVPVSGLTSGVQAIATGQSHTCALVNGGVQCWGRNQLGQLGNNSTTDSRVPVPVIGLTSGVQAIAAGYYYACAVVNGGVKCWGYNYYGQLGNNSTTDSRVPVAVVGLTSGVQAIAAGESHACALVSSGIQCWGFNQDGQLGNNSTTDSRVPVPVSGLTSSVQAIAAGSYHTCAVVNGGLQCWGINNLGQLGNGSTTHNLVPVAVAGLTSGVQAMGPGNSHTCALVNGGAQCWGWNISRQLGNSSTAESHVPVAVTDLPSGVQALATGGSNNCVLVDDRVQCWGWNGQGQLGNNSTTDSYAPVSVLLSFPTL